MSSTNSGGAGASLGAVSAGAAAADTAAGAAGVAGGAADPSWESLPHEVVLPSLDSLALHVHGDWCLLVQRQELL